MINSNYDIYMITSFGEYIKYNKPTALIATEM